MSEEGTIEEVCQEDEAMDEAARWYYSEIMQGLLQSSRFVNWFQVNFDIHKIIDEEEKMITIRVLEVPPELVQQRMIEIMEAQTEPDVSRIVSATIDDVKALEKAAKNGRRK